MKFRTNIFTLTKIFYFQASTPELYDRSKIDIPDIVNDETIDKPAFLSVMNIFNLSQQLLDQDIQRSALRQEENYTIVNPENPSQHAEISVPAYAPINTTGFPQTSMKDLNQLEIQNVSKGFDNIQLDEMQEKTRMEEVAEAACNGGYPHR